jgi:hypothetical protein
VQPHQSQVKIKEILPYQIVDVILQSIKVLQFHEIRMKKSIDTDLVHV